LNKAVENYVVSTTEGL